MSEVILDLTEAARDKIESVMRAEKLTDDSAVRVSVDELGAAFRYRLEFVAKSERAADDAAVDAGGILILIDAESVPRIRGATLEFIDDLSGSGFRFDNPNKPKLLENPLAARVQKVLEDQINPGVASHGGVVSLMGVEGTRVFVRLGGGCQGCGMADVTLKDGIEAALREQIPEITEILDTTDHASGTNPYYEQSR
jgi:Fe/S biogenesis protein NfuA